jgi:hypothetical protein
LSHFLDRLKVTLGGNRESRLDDIHAQAVELMGKASLLRGVHAATGRLFSIPQRGIKYSYVFSVYQCFLQGLTRVRDAGRHKLKGPSPVCG